MTKPEDSKQAIPSPEDRVRALCDWLKFEARDRTNEAKGRRSTADVMRKATEEQLCAAKRTAERMHGHKLPNVSTDRKSAKLSADMDDRIATKLEAQAQQLSAWASLVEELIPFCDSPCGHTSQYAYSEDGGKNIVCLICEREELKGQVVSASPQPKCPRCTDSTLTIGQGDGRFWVTCGRGHAAEVPLDFQIADFAQFFAPADEAALLRKRKDYHAEYVEAVEAAEKAERERDEYLETGQRIQGDFERAKEAYVCSERELGVMREALRKIGDPGEKVDSLMEARMIARAALTPEPASQAAKEKP